MSAKHHTAKATATRIQKTFDTLNRDIWRAHQRGACLDAIADRILRASRRAAQGFFEIGDGLCALSIMDLVKRFFGILGILLSSAS